MDKRKLKELISELIKPSPNTEKVKSLTEQLELIYCSDSAEQMLHLLEVLNIKTKNDEGPGLS